MDDEYEKNIEKQLKKYLILLCLTVMLIVCGVVSFVMIIVEFVALLTGHTYF